MAELTGKVAIVTGAGSGIGRAIALEFAAEGAAVVVADTKSNDTAETIRSTNGGRAIEVICDVSVEANVQELVAATIAEFDQIDILVNNAGVVATCLLESMATSMWDRVFDVNVKGVFFCSRAVIPAMRENGGGKIINIASGLFFMGLPTVSAYVASKGAVIGLTRSLSRELGDANIQVNALTPGITDTPGVTQAGHDPGFVDVFVQQQAIRRFATPDDLVGGAVFLASKRSNFMTGQILNIDGGMISH